MLQVLQLITVILGISTTGLSVYLAYRFYRIKAELSSALSLMLLGEAVAGFITVLFSISSIVNSLSGIDVLLWNTLPSEYAIFLRWVLFITVGATSIHLFNKINNGIGDDRSDFR